RPSDRRWPRHAVASGAPGFRGVVRPPGRGDPRVARRRADDVGGCAGHHAVIILGLTGSIGMGKSTAAAMLRRLGVPLIDADLVVHRLLAPSGAAVPMVSAAFPGVVTEAGGIDRAQLGQRVFTDSAALKRLESILHLMVAAEEKRFLARSRARREPLVVLDIPLLFETGAERRCDYVLVVSAPALVQRQRVLRR